VIDEAAQALEAAALIPLLLAPRLVCAGDHCQLPPTVTSAAAAAGGLGFTLAERIVRLWGDGAGGAGGADAGARAPLCPFTPREPVVHMLTEQYRMHAAISDWASAAMYGGRLRAAGSAVSADNATHASAASWARSTAPEDVSLAHAASELSYAARRAAGSTSTAASRARLASASNA